MDIMLKGIEMPVTRDEVLWGYRMILGREPESEEAILRHLSASDRHTLRTDFLGCPEFAKLHSGQAKNEFRTLPIDLPKIEVDTAADDSQLSECISKISAAWRHLGSIKPHFSVLTNTSFLPDKLPETIDRFWGSGEKEAKELDIILGRHEFGLLSDKTCVEYGCGVGRVTMGLARRFEKVHAYDISLPHLSIAQERAKEIRADNVEFHLCSEGVNTPLHECDVFFSILVFQHNPPPVIGIMIGNALRSLRPGGIAIFQVPTYRIAYRFKTDEWLALPNTMDMEMHCFPQPVIFEIIGRENCVPLEIREIAQKARNKHISNLFVIRKIA